MFCCENMLQFCSCSQIMHSCADVLCLVYQDGQACIVTKRHLHVSFISVIMSPRTCWHCAEYSHVITSLSGYCLKHFPLLIRPAYKLWKLHHPIHCYIGETQLNNYGVSEHNLISDVDILQCRAERFGKGCHL